MRSPKALYIVSIDGPMTSLMEAYIDKHLSFEKTAR
jgi:hypothetical protein